MNKTTNTNTGNTIGDTKKRTRDEIIQDIDYDVLNCAICLDSVSYPGTLPCGHSFCMLCIMRLVEKTPKLLCPTCRKITKNNIEPNLILDHILSSICKQDDYVKRSKKAKRIVESKHFVENYKKSKRFENVVNLVNEFIIEKKSCTYKELREYVAFYDEVEIQYVLKRLFKDRDLYVVNDKMITQEHIDEYLCQHNDNLSKQERIKIVVQLQECLDLSSVQLERNITRDFMVFEYPFDFLNRKQLSKLELATKLSCNKQTHK